MENFHVRNLSVFCTEKGLFFKDPFPLLRERIFLFTVRGTGRRLCLQYGHRSSDRRPDGHDIAPHS